MSELIKLEPANRNKILLTRRSREGIKHSNLLRRAKSGLWEPDPPVILSRMPESYAGRYKFHLYHGLHRLMVAQEKGLELNGLIVGSADEIPPSERLARGVQDREFWSPDESLEVGLRSFLTINRLDSSPMAGARVRPMDASYNLELLLAELQRQEAEDIVPYGFSGIF